MVTSVMNETDMSNKARYTKRVLDCLSVFRREYQMMEREVPKGPVTGGGGEGQVQLLVEQPLKKKDEEVRAHTVLYYTIAGGEKCCSLDKQL